MPRTGTEMKPSSLSGRLLKSSINYSGYTPMWFDIGETWQSRIK